MHPRFSEPALARALEDSPVVLVHGPRQCGKSTLVQAVGQKRGSRYLSFDDPTVLAAAVSDPTGFVADLEGLTILDEVQRVPGLFAVLKLEVDRRRRPGRFLLTGSANVLQEPTLSDSLAGRMSILRLHPLAQCEMEDRRSPPPFLEELFAGRFAARSFERLGARLADRVAAGGYPAAIARRPDRVAAWYRDYVAALLGRDLRTLVSSRPREELGRLLELAVAHTASLQNASELASAFELSRPTIRSYLHLLERLFLVESLPPWHRNRLSRLVKTAKLHAQDTGIASALLGLDAAGLWEDRQRLGQLLETFVYQELRKLASFRDDDIRFHHFRDRDGVEVDLVLERGGRVAGVETKASATITAADFRGLRKLKAAAGAAFAGGAVLYDGETSGSFGGGLYAVPLRALWESA